MERMCAATSVPRVLTRAVIVSTASNATQALIAKKRVWQCAPLVLLERSPSLKEPIPLLLAKIAILENTWNRQDRLLASHALRASTCPSLERLQREIAYCVKLASSVALREALPARTARRVSIKRLDRRPVRIVRPS